MMIDVISCFENIAESEIPSGGPARKGRCLQKADRERIPSSDETEFHNFLYMSTGLPSTIKLIIHSLPWFLY
jgi:hypothetical protein